MMRSLTAAMRRSSASRVLSRRAARSFVKFVGAVERDGDTAAGGGVAQGGGHVGFADPDGPEDDHVGGVLGEPEGGEVGP
jgi:hypothetical protein